MINALIIDDEFSARQNLKNLLSLFCPQVKIIGEADGVQDGIRSLNKRTLDLVFLDIYMNDGSGFDLLDAFPEPPFDIVFTTAYDQFALKAFDYHAINYLLKPINPEKLVSTIDRLQSALGQSKGTSQFSNLVEDIRTKQFDKITLSTKEGLFVIPLNDIICLESSGGYTTFHRVNGERITIAKTIKEYEEILPRTDFFRIHRSYIVALKYIKGIMAEEGGYLLTINNTKLPIARRKREDLIGLLKKDSL